MSGSAVTTGLDAAGEHLAHESGERPDLDPAQGCSLCNHREHQLMEANLDTPRSDFIVHRSWNRRDRGASGRHSDLDRSEAPTEP